MITKTTLIVAIAAISYLIPGVQIAATFDPERLRLIDSSESSLLVRGNAPLNRRGRFDPFVVLDAIQEHLVPERNLKRHKIVVVSLLSSYHSDERAVLEEQKSFIQGQQSMCREEGCRYMQDSDELPPLGELLHRPVVGSWTAPTPLNSLPSQLNNAVWDLWRPDDGAWVLAEEIRTIFMSATPDDSCDADGVVIYIHCMRGMDRTGLVAGAYMTRFLNATEEQVHRSNYGVARRELNWPARNALKWIAWRGRQISPVVNEMGM